MTYKFKNSYIKNCYTIAGMYEKDGPIGKYFDKTYDNNFDALQYLTKVKYPNYFTN